MREKLSSLCYVVGVVVSLSLCSPSDAAQDTPKEGKAKRQTVCPVMGGKINKKVYLDHGGKRIYFCCPGCIAKVKEDPGKYITKLEAEGIVLDKTPAQLCAKCGEVKGSDACCKVEGHEKCPKCGLHKGSPGCCKHPEK